MINGQTELLGIIGNPIKHSLSPQIHNFLLQHYQINAVYLPLVVTKSEPANIISALSNLNIKGANITIPYKTTIIDQLDFVDEYARQIDSVNCIVNKNGKWCGYSTDGLGFICGLNKLADLTAKRFLIIGAGGAAKAIVNALLKLEPKNIYITNRTNYNAEKIIRRLNYNAKLYADEDYDVLINCTNQGMDNISLPIAKKIIAKASYVIDIIYSPSKTPLLQIAEKQGKLYQNGIPMLLFQAQLSFGLFTGILPPIELLEQALKKNL